MESTGQAQARRSRVAPIVALALLLGLLGLIVVRYNQAVAERAAFADANTAAAIVPAAGAAPVAMAVHAVRGVAARWQANVPVAGTLAPVRESSLSFKIAGRLAAVHVKVGDVVKLGQVLATLDASDIVAQQRAANAQVHSAEVSLEIARDEEGRSKSLLATGAVSDAMHRGNAQRVELARAALEAAQAQAATVAAALDSTRLVAPFSGLVTQAPSAPGVVVSPMTPMAVLFRIEDTTALRFTGTLSIDDAALAHVGAPIAVDGHDAQGTLTAILPSVDPQTRRVPIFAEIKNDPKSPMLAGVFVRAVIQAGAAIDVVKLPAEALRPGSQNELVLVVDKRAQLTPVVFARDDDGALLVRSGVRLTDTVVLAPSASTKTGDAITLAPNAG